MCKIIDLKKNPKLPIFQTCFRTNTPLKIFENTKSLLIHMENIFK